MRGRRRVLRGRRRILRRRRRVLGRARRLGPGRRGRRVGRRRGRVGRRGGRHARGVRAARLADHGAGRRVARARRAVGRRGGTKDARRRRAVRRRGGAIAHPRGHARRGARGVVRRARGHVARRGGRVAVRRALRRKRRAHGTLARAEVVAVPTLVAADLDQGREHGLLLHAEVVVHRGRAGVVGRHAARRAPAGVVRGHAELGLQQVVVRHHVLEHVHVQVQVKGAGAHRRHLAKHHVLRHTLAVVHVAHCGRLHEDLDRLLKGAAHQRTLVGAVDAVPGDGHQRALAGHDVHQQGEVAVVDVGAVELNHIAHLLEQRGACGLDTKHAENLDAVVRERAGDVHTVDGQHVAQVGPVGLEHVLLDRVPLARDRVHAARGLVLLDDEHLADARHALERNVGEHLLREGLEEHVLLALHLLVGVVVHDADAQHELLGVVLRVHHKDVLAKHGADLGRHLGHGQVLVEHRGTVQHQAQQPGRLPLQARLHLLVGDGEEGLHELAVLGDHRGARVGVVEHLERRGDRLERRVRQSRLDLLGRLLRGAVLGVQVHGHRRRLDVLRTVDDLLETRHTERHVLARHTRIVERVERHLRRRLADALRRERAAHLARLRHTAGELALDLAQDPLPRLAGDVVHLDRLLAAEVRAHVDLEQQRGVLLHRTADRIVPTHHRELVQRAAQAVHDLEGRQVARLPRVDVEDLLRVEHQTRDVQRQIRVHHVRLEDLVAQQLPVALQLRKLLVQQLLQLRRPVAQPGTQRALPEAALAQVHAEPPAELGVAQPVRDELLPLHHGAVDAVLAVGKLDHIVHRVAHRTVVADRHVLQRLDQAALDVARLGRLHRGVDQTLAPGHGVEEELVRGEATQVRVLHEPTALGRKVVLGEVRQGAVAEAERNALTLDRLLPDTRRHLRDVDERALGPGHHHLLHVVVVRQVLLRVGPDIVARLVQDSVHVGLERLTQGHTRVRLEPVVACVLDQPHHIRLGLGDGGVDVGRGGLVRHRITDADGKAVVQQPEVDHPLHAAEEVPTHHRAALAEDDVDQTTCRRADDLFVDRAVHDLTVLNMHAVVLHKHILGRLGIALEHVDPLGYAHGQDLLARPVRLGLEDARLWHDAVPVRHPEQDVLHLLKVQQAITQAELADPAQCVLDDAHHGLVRLRRHDLPRHPGDLGQLGTCFLALRDMQVHLITVKVGVIRRRHTEVEPEGGVVHQLHPVHHHAHLVQTRLPVEEHIVAVAQMALHDPAGLQSDLAAPVVLEINALARVTDHIASAGVFGRPIADQFRQVRSVKRRHPLGVCEVASNTARHADLVELQVRVARNHGTCREVHTLAHQVATQAALLALEACADRLDRAARRLQRLRQACNVVVHVRRHMVLQQVRKVVENVRRRTLLLHPGEVRTGADDVGQLVGEVVLAHAAAKLGHTRAHLRRRHGQHGKHHPVGLRKLLREAQGGHVLGRHLLQDRVHLGGRERALLGLCHARRARLLVLLLALAPHGEELERLLADRRLEPPAASMTDLGLCGLAQLILLLPLISLTHADFGAVLPHPLEAALPARTGGLKHALEHRVGDLAWLAHARAAAPTYRIGLQLATVHTDALEQLLDLVQEAHVEHGPGQVNVAKVAGALGHALTARLALVVPVNRAKAGVRKTADLVLPCSIILHLGVLDFAHRKRSLDDCSVWYSNTSSHTHNLLRAQDAKLDLAHRTMRRNRRRKPVTVHRSQPSGAVLRGGEQRSLRAKRDRAWPTTIDRIHSGFRGVRIRTQWRVVLVSAPSSSSSGEKAPPRHACPSPSATRPPPPPFLFYTRPLGQSAQSNTNQPQ